MLNVSSEINFRDIVVAVRGSTGLENIKLKMEFLKDMVRKLKKDEYIDEIGDRK